MKNDTKVDFFDKFIFNNVKSNFNYKTLSA